MRVVTVSSMRTSLTQMIGIDSLLSAETDASTRSFNRFGRLAWDRTAWPFVSRLTQVVPDVRVRSIDVGSGGTSYSSAPTVAVAGAATATSTINSDGEVNGIAVTANGTAYVSVPAVTFSGGGGSGATATANLLAYLDFGTTISEVFRVTDKDPWSAGSANDIAFKNTFVTGSSEYGEAILPNRSSTSPVWVHYRAPFPSFGGSATDYPWIFAEYAVIGAYSDWLTADGQTDRAGVALQQAEQVLQVELDKLERQEGQTQPILIETYGTTIAAPA